MTASERDDLLVAIARKQDAEAIKTEGIAKDVAEIKAVTYGDGGDDKPGLRMRVDRLEQLLKYTAWLVGALLAAAIAGVADYITRQIKGGP